MSWQKCPLCKGSGVDPNPGTYASIPICDVCKGAKIISELTGLPPNNTMTLSSGSTINIPSVWIDQEPMKPLK